MLSFFRRQFSTVPAVQRWLLRTAGWGLSGLAAGWLVSFVLPEPYTSEATLQVVPATVFQDLLPHESVDVQNLLDREKPMVLSRNVLTTIVNNFDLYRSERRREPMEDVIDEFRKAVRIELSGAKLIRVAFTYPDRLLANKVTQDLASRIISENLILERDQKRKEYESMAQKLETTKILNDLASRGQDTRLELLDAATMPQEPDTPPWVIGLIGLGCGLAVGLLTALWRALRRTKPEIGVPSA